LPPPRWDFGMAYDAAREQVVMFGGNGQYVYWNDTWVWDGTNWTQKHPTNAPPNRRGNVMTYDAAHNVVVLFGGTGYSNPLSYATASLNDTWTWDGTNWTLMHPATSPPGRDLASMSYDPVRGKVVLFGGQDLASGTKFGDTWEWDGSNWTQLAPANSPAPRVAAAMAYDVLRGYTLLYGGNTSSGYVFQQDTWTWDGTNWTQQNSADTPPATIVGMTYDAARAQLVTFGGWTASQHYFAEDVWAWDQPPAVVATGMISVTTNVAGATFTVVGPATYNGNGTSWLQSGAPTGAYTITFNPVTGYTPPASQTLTLTSCGSIAFTGTYVALPTGTITVSTNVAAASFTLVGPATYSGSGASWSQASAPMGPYTITYNDVPGYTTPVPQTLTLAASGTIAFTGTYVGIPTLTQVIPNTGQPGQQNLQVSITGQFTDFQQGLTTVDFGPGITVILVTVNSATSLTVTIDIDPAATPGARTLTVSTSDPQIVKLVNGFTIIAASTDACQTGYAANLNVGDSLVNITNNGASDPAATPGTLCVNVYAFDPSEEMLACCTCPVTPNGLASMSLENSVLDMTMTGEMPSSLVIKLVATSNTGANCNAANVTSLQLAPGMVAWGTTLHSVSGGSYGVSENRFVQDPLSQAELNHLTSFCSFLQSNGSGRGVCSGCKPGAQ